MSAERPLLALTLGDPAGIGPEVVLKACDLALAGEVEAVVTAPLNKEAMNLAGYAYAGPWAGLRVVTKAGGFGREGSLAAAVDQLQKGC